MGKKNEEGELAPFRCFRCGRLLAKEAILVGIVEIKCKNCKAINTLVGEYSLNFEEEKNAKIKKKT